MSLWSENMLEIIYIFSQICWILFGYLSVWSILGSVPYLIGKNVYLLFFFCNVVTCRCQLSQTYLFCHVCCLIWYSEKKKICELNNLVLTCRNKLKKNNLSTAGEMTNISVETEPQKKIGKLSKYSVLKINKIDKHLSRLNRKKRRKDSKSEMTKEILKLIQHKVKG